MKDQSCERALHINVAMMSVGVVNFMAVKLLCNLKVSPNYEATTILRWMLSVWENMTTPLLKPPSPY